MKKSKNAFFLTVSLATTFMLSLVIIQKPTNFSSWAKRNQKKPNKNVAINFSQGWNLVALPIDTGLMASDLCTMFGEQIDGYPLSKYGGGYSGWGDLYYCTGSSSSVDFALDPYVAFMVYIADDGFSWIFNGRKVAVNYDIVEGYNAVGVNVNRFKMASDLCGRTLSPNYNVINIDKWEGDYTRYLCGGNQPDYVLFEGEGYFVEVEPVNKPLKSGGSSNPPIPQK